MPFVKIAYMVVEIHNKFFTNDLDMHYMFLQDSILFEITSILIFLKNNSC